RQRIDCSTFFEQVDLLASERIPKCDRVVEARCCKGLSVRRKCHRRDPPSRILPVVLPNADLLTGGCFPQADRTIPAPGCQSLAVRRKRSCPNGVFMCLDDPDFLAAGHLP